MKLLLILSLMSIQIIAQAQSAFFTKAGTIRFESRAPLENIQSIHRSVTTVLDASSGRVQFSVLMRGFEFHKSLMQQHFNENYVESDKFPKATFVGIIENNQLIDYSVDGIYAAAANGQLTIHGVTKTVRAAGKVFVERGKISLQAEFSILLSDYKISIPSIVKDKVSDRVQILVNCKLQPLRSAL